MAKRQNTVQTNSERFTHKTQVIMRCALPPIFIKLVISLDNPICILLEFYSVFFWMRAKVVDFGSVFLARSFFVYVIVQRGKFIVFRNVFCLLADECFYYEVDWSNLLFLWIIFALCLHAMPCRCMQYILLMRFITYSTVIIESRMKLVKNAKHVAIGLNSTPFDTPLTRMLPFLSNFAVWLI